MIIICHSNASPLPNQIKIRFVHDVFNHFFSSFSEEAREHGYSIITDMRASTWQSLKAFFKVLQVPDFDCHMLIRNMISKYCSSNLIAF